MCMCAIHFKRWACGWYSTSFSQLLHTEKSKKNRFGFAPLKRDWKEVCDCDYVCVGGCVCLCGVCFCNVCYLLFAHSRMSILVFIDFTPLSCAYLVVCSVCAAHIYWRNLQSSSIIWHFYYFFPIFLKLDGPDCFSLTHACAEARLCFFYSLFSTTILVLIRYLFSSSAQLPSLLRCWLSFAIRSHFLHHLLFWVFSSSSFSLSFFRY